MSTPDPTPSHDVLERARAYVRVDQRVVAALPELGEAIRSFEPVPGHAGESVAEWLVERALSEPQEATVRVRLNCSFSGQVRRRVLVSCETDRPSHLSVFV